MDKLTSFVTGVGLITSNGPHGYNVMSAEWTYQISYEPNLIAICIRKTRITAENITVSKEFGVNMAASNQNVVSSVAGNNHGNVVDKIAVLNELGVEFYKAEKIDVLMIKGATANIECKLVQIVDIGDHPIFIGEVVMATEADTELILYHDGKYFKLGERVFKPKQDVLDSIEEILKKHSK